tara:strand:+ start:334 stop:1110 length:777 start_codon:yes stop_codon:yes gene_type:complete
MRNIVAGNWKSNKLINEGQELINEIAKGLPSLDSTDVIIAPPTPYLAHYSRNFVATNGIQFAAQQCSANSMGAHTGEFTASMLTSCGIQHVIIGHSERRDRFGENLDVVRAKVNEAIAAGLHVLLCCGESLDVRESGNHFDLISTQLSDAFQQVKVAQMSQITVAYEPVWAIGTGVTASAEQAQEMHRFIRERIEEWYTVKTAESTRILYGGSCKPSNANEIFSQPDVNGGLIGGAALDAKSFLSLIEASETSQKHSQ